MKKIEIKRTKARFKEDLEEFAIFEEDLPEAG